MSLELLITKLRELNSSTLTDVELGAAVDDDAGYKYFYPINDDGQHPLIQEIKVLACGELIMENGRNHQGGIMALKAAGFRVFCGEKDSFGWLTGCISTDRGIIVYG